ncbi:MAG TPA: hypothetical protein VF843_01520 [Streptosporangiaceae bacterium]
MTATAPVLSAGVGVRYESRWALRMASFRVRETDLGSATLGIVTPRSAAATALIHLLSGQVAPGYGSLRVLGYDMNSPAGRAAVSRQCGIASRAWRPVPGARVRGLVERAARRSGQPGTDRHLLVAAILDRLALTPWADVPFWAAPEQVARKVRLAIACVHQPKLLLLDGLLDHLPPLTRTVLADVIRDLQRDTAVVALGQDADTLALICEQVIGLSDGIVVGARTPPPAAPPAVTWQPATSGLGAPRRPAAGGR